MKLSLKVVLLVFIHYESQRYVISAASAIENEINNSENKNNQVFRASYAKRMKSYMNTSMDPCDDFYSYACGNYPNVIEDIELIRKQNSLYDYSQSMDRIIDEILEKERQKNETYYEELQKVKYFVEICDKADLFPLKPSEEYLNTIKAIGGFPAVDQTWNASAFDWFNMTAHLVRYGVVGLVMEKVHERHPFTVYYDIGKFGFGFDVYSENIETMESLGYIHNAEMMKRLLEVYGVTDSKAADKVIEEIIDFWREALVFQNKSIYGCHGPKENESIKNNYFPQWNSLESIAWKMRNCSSIDFSPCPCPFYYNQINVMANKSSEPFANYMALKFLYQMHPQVKSAKHQHQHCVSKVKYAIPMVLTYFYIKEHFTNKTIQEVEEIIKEIVKSFTIIIETNDWLDNSTQSIIKETLQKLNFTIGQAVDPISDIYIMETNKLNLTNNYALNNLELAKFKVDISRHVFFNCEIYNESMLPLDILKAIHPNSFYDNTKHTINVLAGKLFPPIYHRYLPKSMNYAGLGYIIGHEIVHSIDIRRLLLANMSEISKISMKSNFQCFIDHQSNVTVPELNIKLDWRKCVKESICDSGGLRGSLAAFRNVLIESNEIDYEKMESMPELNLSPDQLFFLNFAQVYCAKYESRHYWNEFNNRHPIDKYRVLWPLQNFDEFSKVFNCSLGSPMNPEKKCRMF